MKKQQQISNAFNSQLSKVLIVFDWNDFVIVELVFKPVSFDILFKNFDT